MLLYERKENFEIFLREKCSRIYLWQVGKIKNDYF